MKKITLVKAADSPEFLSDLDVFMDAHIIDTFKKDDKEKVIEFTNSEHAFQVGFERNGRYFKSNAYFFNRTPDPKVSIYWFGSKLVLTVLESH
jgi:hypothetical protein